MVLPPGEPLRRDRLERLDRRPSSSPQPGEEELTQHRVVVVLHRLVAGLRRHDAQTHEAVDRHRRRRALRQRLRELEREDLGDRRHQQELPQLFIEVGEHFLEEVVGHRLRVATQGQGREVGLVDGRHDHQLQSGRPSLRAPQDGADLPLRDADVPRAEERADLVRREGEVADPEFEGHTRDASSGHRDRSGAAPGQDDVGVAWNGLDERGEQQTELRRLGMVHVVDDQHHTAIGRAQRARESTRGVGRGRTGHPLERRGQAPVRDPRDGGSQLAEVHRPSRQREPDHVRHRIVPHLVRPLAEEARLARSGRCADEGQRPRLVQGGGQPREQSRSTNVVVDHDGDASPRRAGISIVLIHRNPPNELTRASPPLPGSMASRTGALNPARDHGQVRPRRRAANESAAGTSAPKNSASATPSSVSTERSTKR